MKTATMWGALILLGSMTSAQQLLVFPAVTDEQPGENGSLWVTTAMIVKNDPLDDVTITRKWVCLSDGGFEDDPATAPTWEIPFTRLIFSLGGELLVGTDATAGAVALEVEGGEVLAHSNIMDVRWGEYSADEKLAFGQGQYVNALRSPLQGPSHIPWLGGFRGGCDPDPTWRHLRNNIGIVNPNPEPLVVVGKALPFGYYNTPYSDGWAEFPTGYLEAFRKVVPAYGWRQFRWQTELTFCNQWDDFSPVSGFVINLIPERDDLPYYAYASVVFAPDPSSACEFNDPMFIPAEQGYVRPHGEAPSNATP